MYKILTAAGLSIMLNRSLIIGQTRHIGSFLGLSFFLPFSLSFFLSFFTFFHSLEPARANKHVHSSPLSLFYLGFLSNNHNSHLPIIFSHRLFPIRWLCSAKIQLGHTIRVQRQLATQLPGQLGLLCHLQQLQGLRPRLRSKRHRLRRLPMPRRPPELGLPGLCLPRGESTRHTLCQLGGCGVATRGLLREVR